MRKILVVLLLFFFQTHYSQELNATVNFNTSQVAATNQQIFVTLKKSLTDFINNNKWSNLKFKPNEKIDCSFFFTINSITGDEFSTSLQVQASRPVFNSTYATSILNINDKEVDFRYTEFQNLNFDINSFDSNLISVVAFYANMIIGIDEDTFALNGGTTSLQNAQNIVNVAQQSQTIGWSPTKGNQNRYYLVNDMLAPAFAPFRKAMFQYHFSALDLMSDNTDDAKENIKTALKTLQEINDYRPNAYLTRVFFDSKADEIISIFNGGPKTDITEVVETLNRLSPLNSSKWSQIKY
jgi:hypothetical protein